MKSFAILSIVLGAGLVGIGCGSGDAPKDPASAPGTPAKTETPAAAATATLKSPATFATLQPYFEAHCYGCHGNAKRKAGGFDLTSYAGAMKGGEDGVMIKAGDPDGSTLLAYLKGTKKPQMPAKSPPLPDGDIQVISDWIKDGAKEK